MTEQPTDEPRPPTGVRATFAGRTIYADLVEYVGLDPETGQHHWTASFPGEWDPDQLETVNMDLLPAHTSVDFAFKAAPPEEP